jgi:hypothetical protein
MLGRIIMGLLFVTALVAATPLMALAASPEDAQFVAWVEAKADERTDRGGAEQGFVAPTPEERSWIESNLRNVETQQHGDCGQYDFSADALHWLNLYGFCAATTAPPPSRGT